MQLTHQTAGDAEPDPRVPHSPHMKSSHSTQIKPSHSPQMRSSHPPQMKARMEFVSQTEASLSLTKANMILVCETWSDRFCTYTGEFQNVLHSNGISASY